MEATSYDITAHIEAWPITTVPFFYTTIKPSTVKPFSTIHCELQGTLLPRREPSQSPCPRAGWGKEEEEKQDENWSQKQLSSHVFPASYSQSDCGWRKGKKRQRRFLLLSIIPTWVHLLPQENFPLKDEQTLLFRRCDMILTPTTRHLSGRQPTASSLTD